MVEEERERERGRDRVDVVDTLGKSAKRSSSSNAS